MKIARNAPCPCGSGKKYKKCCLELNQSSVTDEKQEVVENQSERDLEETGCAYAGAVQENNPEELVETEDDLIWNEFLRGSFKQRADIINEIMDRPGFMAKFDCFELFNELHASTQSPSDCQSFKELIQKLKEQDADNYHSISAFAYTVLIEYAIFDGNNAEAEKIFLEFAENPDKDIDSFNIILEQMVYCSDLDLLLIAMRKGWEKVKNSSKIVSWGIDEYARLASNYEIFHYISVTPQPDPMNPDLLTRLKKFVDPDNEKLKNYIAALTNTSERNWSVEDFNYRIRDSKKRKTKGTRKEVLNRVEWISNETFSTNVNGITDEFLGYLVRKENFSYPKAEMAKLDLSKYFIQRLQKKLKNKNRLLDPSNKSQTKFEQILCPDHQSLSVYVDNMFDFFSFRVFRAAILIETIPAWLRFIESKGLIDNSVKQRAIASTYKLVGILTKIINEHEKEKQYVIPQLERAFL